MILLELEWADLDSKSSNDGVRLAERIARRIEERIAVERLPVGYPIGREAELAAAAGVSRWTFREAIGLLEQNGLVEARRGGGGGLFVAARMVDVLSTGLGNYLDFIRVTPAELAAALAAAEAVAVERLSRRLTPEMRADLMPMVAEIRDSPRPEALLATARLRGRLVELAGNPALSLLSGAVGWTVMQAAWYSTLDDGPFHGVMARLIAATHDLALALIERRIADARGAMGEYVGAACTLFDASSPFGGLARRPGSTERAYRTYPPGRPRKKAEVVARELREIIVESGWRTGMRLGTEGELMERFDVGRPVLREALRSLERMGVIAIGRGGASGVRVISPNPESLVTSCRGFLCREGLDAAQAHEVRTALLAAQVAGGALPPGRSRRALAPLMLDILTLPAASETLRTDASAG